MRLRLHNTSAPVHEVVVSGGTFMRLLLLEKGADGAPGLNLYRKHFKARDADAADDRYLVDTLLRFDPSPSAQEGRAVVPKRDDGSFGGWGDAFSRDPACGPLVTTWSTLALAEHAAHFTLGDFGLPRTACLTVEPVYAKEKRSALAKSDARRLAAEALSGGAEHFRWAARWLGSTTQACVPDEPAE